MSNTEPSRVGFEGSQPILRVEDMKASLALEFQVEDPDGNVLQFGSEPRAE